MGNSPGLIKRLDATGVPLVLARLGVGGMFAYLAVMKLLDDPFEFLKQIHAYGILPAQPPLFVNLTAAVLPWLELTCAAGLLLGVGVRGAALLFNGMLVFFTPTLLIRAIGIYTDPSSGVGTFCAVRFDCGCGTGEVYICNKLAENLALQLGALIALFSSSRLFCLSAMFTRRRSVKAK